MSVNWVDLPGQWMSVSCKCEATKQIIFLKSESFLKPNSQLMSHQSNTYVVNSDIILYYHYYCYYCLALRTFFSQTKLHNGKTKQALKATCSHKLF